MKEIIDALEGALNDLMAIDEQGSHGRTIDLIITALDKIKQGEL
jgi:hypothetical protein